VTPKRRAAILAALAAGHVIYRRWSGSRRNGQLSHRLEGVSRLREPEVEQLRLEGHIVSLYSDCERCIRLTGHPPAWFTFTPLAALPAAAETAITNLQRPAEP